MASLLRLYLLKLTNYRNYSKVQFEFSQEPNRPITIFHGSMSAGKTSIMNAIHWCLYGNEPHFINEGEGKPIIHQKALNETELSKSVTTEVELTFANESGPLFIVSRFLNARRVTDQRTKIYNSLANGLIDSGFILEEEKYFKYLDRETGGWEIIDDSNIVDSKVERYFPSDLSNFIFFNGEMLDKFFSSLQSQNIKTGIERVSGLTIVDDAIGNLKDIEAQYRKKASSDVSEANYLNDKIQRINEKLSELRPEIEIYQNRKLEFLGKEEKLNDVLSIHPEAAIREQQSNLEEAKKNLKLLKARKEDNRDKQRKFINQYFARTFLLNPIRSSLEVLQDAESKGITPPPIESHFLEEKLLQRMCICGRALEENSDEWNLLNNLLSKLLDSEVASEANLGRGILGEIIRESTDKVFLTEELNEYRKERDSFDEDTMKTEARIEQILKSLREFGVERVRKIGQQLTEVQDEITKLERKISPMVADMERLEASLAENEEKLDRETEKSDKAKRWRKRQDLAKTLRENLTQLHESTLNEIRRRVEEQTNAIFSKLISRRWQLDRVIISPDYKIRVLDKEGVDNLKTLSAGQTLYLSLSFISALRQITATNYPMVIDSPFGKVSGEERIWAAEDLPIFLPDTQITFLVTDTEYSSDVSNILTNTKIPSIREVLLKNDKVWKEFNLVISKEDDVSSKTEVVEYVKV